MFQQLHFAEHVGTHPVTILLQCGILPIIDDDPYCVYIRSVAVFTKVAAYNGANNNFGDPTFKTLPDDAQIDNFLGAALALGLPPKSVGKRRTAGHSRRIQRYLPSMHLAICRERVSNTPVTSAGNCDLARSPFAVCICS